MLPSLFAHMFVVTRGQRSSTADYSRALTHWPCDNNCQTIYARERFSVPGI